MESKRKKDMHALEAKITEVTTFRMNRIVNKRFRGVCALKGLRPRDLVEDLIREWTDRNLEEIGSTKIGDLLSHQSLSQNDQ